MCVTVGADVLWQYRRFSLFNSPYAAHDDGSAIDLYPPADADTVPSPVAGTVVDTRTVRAPPRPYAAPEDHLVLVDVGGRVARLLHVDPAVATGDRVAVGDPLGAPVRAGFFAPWVPDHLHLEFRPADANPYRASGSVPLTVDVPIEGLAWDGTGTVVESGETWARLDRPAHPAPGERFVGLAGDGTSTGTRPGRGDGTVTVLDGGFPHYEAGGLLGGGERARLAGVELGTVDGRVVTWADLTVRANGDPVRGVACYLSRDDFGVKLVGEAVDLAVGEAVTVTVEA